MRYSKNQNIHKKVNKNSTKNRMRITKKKSKQIHLRNKNRRNTKNVRNRRRVNKSIKYGGMEANSNAEEDLLRRRTEQDNITIRLQTENKTTDIEVNPTENVFTAIRNTLNLPQNQNISVLLGNYQVVGDGDSFHSFGIEDDAILIVKVKVTLNIYLSVGMGFGARSLDHRYHITLINVPIDTDLTREDFFKINGWPRREIAIMENNIFAGDTATTQPNELDMINEEDYLSSRVYCGAVDVVDGATFYNTTIDSPNDIIYIGQGISTARTKGVGREVAIQEITLDYEK